MMKKPGVEQNCNPSVPISNHITCTEKYNIISTYSSYS